MVMCIHINKQTYMCIYIYISIYLSIYLSIYYKHIILGTPACASRPRRRRRCWRPPRQVTLYYIILLYSIIFYYIYTHMYVCVYIYIYIYTSGIVCADRCRVVAPVMRTLQRITVGHGTIAASQLRIIAPDEPIIIIYNTMTYYTTL